MIERHGKRAFSDLYAELQPQLVRILASNLHPAQWVIDEACQLAWSSLLEHSSEVPAGVELGWLSTTATRAALRLLRQHRTAPVPEPQAAAPDELPAPVADPAEQLALRERLAEVRRLPVRQQRIVLLHGFGYEYEEIASATGESHRTVKRQLAIARRRLLSAVEDA